MIEPSLLQQQVRQLWPRSFSAQFSDKLIEIS